MSVSYPHARRHDRPHARGGKEDEAAKPRDGNDRAVDVVVMAHWLASAHGRRCRGRWVGATCRSGRRQCSSLSHALATMEGRRAQHVCFRPGACSHAVWACCTWARARMVQWVTGAQWARSRWRHKQGRGTKGRRENRISWRWRARRRLQQMMAVDGRRPWLLRRRHGGRTSGWLNMRGVPCALAAYRDSERHDEASGGASGGSFTSNSNHQVTL